MEVRAETGNCDAVFTSSADVGGLEVSVYRCDWGWCVKRGEVAARSRYLDEALEEALGARFDANALRALVDLLDQALTAEREEREVTAHVMFSLVPRVV